MIINENNIFEVLDGLALDSEDLGDLICWLFDYATDKDSSDVYRGKVLERVKTYLAGDSEMTNHWKSCVEDRS